MKKLTLTAIPELKLTLLSSALQAYLGMSMMADGEENPPVDNVDTEAGEFDEEALALLDKSLDDIEDLPGFEVPYNGRYLLKASASFKRIKSIEKKTNNLATEISLEVMECLAKDNDADPDTIPGTKFSQLFFMQGEDEAVRISMGMMKQFTKPLGEHYGEGNLAKIVRNLQTEPLLLAATIVRRQDKNNPEIYRARLSVIEVQ